MSHVLSEWVQVGRVQTKSANKKLCLLTEYCAGGIWAPRLWLLNCDFSRVPVQCSQGEKGSRHQLCFPKCQQACPIFSSLISPASFPDLFDSTVHKQVPLLLMAPNVTLMFSKCQGFLFFWWWSNIKFNKFNFTAATLFRLLNYPWL